MSEFSASDKTVKDKCMNDSTGSGYAASEVTSSRKKCAFALNVACGA